MLSKAKEMQEQMKKTQELIKTIEVEGVSGGDLVKVILTGDYELKSIKISEAAKKESIEIINDLIIAAYNNAKQKLKKNHLKKFKKLQGELIYLLILNFQLKWIIAYLT